MTETTDVERVVCLVKKEVQGENHTCAGGFINEGTAARYLRAYGTVAKAARNMALTLKYRQNIGADAFGKDRQTSEIFRMEMKKRGLFIAAKSDGDVPPSPILVLRKRKEAFDMADFEDFRRFLFYSLDCTARIADIGINGDASTVVEERGQWVVVMDMANYKEANSPPMSVTRETIRIFQNHFPERAKRVVIVDAPTAFLILWRLVRLFMEPVTRQKFIFVNRLDGQEVLAEHLGKPVVDCIDMDMEHGKEWTIQTLVQMNLLLNE